MNEGDTILTCIYNDKEKFAQAFDYIEDAIYINKVNDEISKGLKEKPIILDII